VIERKAFLQITKAIILGLRNGLTDPSACIKQNIIEELVQILNVERCVIFRIRREEINGASNEFCEIVAGVPFDEYRSDTRIREPLDAHPDIRAAVGNGRMLVIRDPGNDERTAYFRGIVEKKDISEIVYIPLHVEEDGPAVGVIVVDAVRDRRFDDDEILFCVEVADLISLLLGQERAVLQHFRDAIINKVVPLGGFARRLRENLQTTLDYIEVIHAEAVGISSVLPKKLDEQF
jgi:GAF domain-containing protein